MLWFLTQEIAGEAGFDDLLALTQVKMPITAKLEMARNYWDEMGRGRETAMLGPLLGRLANYLEIDAQPDRVVPESLALGNAMLALARSRRYCFQSIGALGVIEMTGSHPGGLCRCGPQAPTHTDQEAALLHAACCTRRQTFGMLEPRGAAVSRRRKPRLRAGDRRRRYYSVVAWLPLLRQVSPAFRLGTAIEQGSSLRVKESSHALLRDR
jgi:heme oxygenase-like protein